MIQRAEERYAYCRAEFPLSMRSMDAFQALSQAYAQAGTRIDALEIHNPNEWERFQFNLLQGADGHVFWAGRSHFNLNPIEGRKAKQLPLYFWWTRLYGDRPFRLVPCEVKGCVSPYHARMEDRRATRERIFPDHVILGALQVWAMQNGRSPRRKEWDTLGMSPSGNTIGKRFGTFENAVVAAGLTPPPLKTRKKSIEVMLAGLHAVATELGRWPSYDTYEHACVGRYVSPSTLRSNFGTFSKAVEAARERYPTL